MLLFPEDINFASDMAVMDSIPALPSEIPPVTSAGNGSTSNDKPGSLYEKLITTPTLSPGSPCLPSSPSLYPFASPYSMGSPSSLMMSTSSMDNDPNWMISNRPRRRRSTYASPSLMPSNLHQHNQYMMSSPNQMALGFNSMNMPFGSPMMMASPYHQGFMMGAPPMSPMNVVVKLPMAPLTPTNLSNYNSSVKIPLVLPCHLQQQPQTQNTAAPNVSKLQTNITASASEVSSAVPSRCSSIAPNSSVSSRSHNSQNWFTEMSVTKDHFLEDVASLDLSNVTVLELKQVLRKFGLNSTGKKAQLVERIKEISNYLKTEGRKRAKVEVKESVGDESTEESEPILSSSGSAINSRRRSQKMSAVV